MNKIIVKDKESFVEFLAFDWESSILSYDWETTSLDYLEMQPVGISFCNGKQVIYIDLFNKDIKYNYYVKEQLKIIFDIDEALFIAHNQPFDLKCCKKFLDCEPKNIFCTMTAAHLLNENTPKNLKYLAEKILKVPKKEILSWEEAKDFGVHSKEFYNYAMNDAIWAYQLWEIESKKLIKKDLEKLFYEIELPFQFVLRDLEIDGIEINTKLLDEYLEKAKILQYEFLLKLCELIDTKLIEQRHLFGNEVEYITPVNFNSGKQIAEILINRFHFNLSITDKGNYITDVKALEALKNNEFVKYLILYRQITKLKSTYLDNIKEKTVNGRLRASFNNCVAVTGRLSSSGPNLQNIPHPNDNIDINIRKLFIAPNGKKLIVLDYSGQELRGAAHVSQDPTMIEAFNHNKDLHLATANECFQLGIPDEILYEAHLDYKLYKKKFAGERFKGKNSINFPIIYGTTAYGISKSLGVTKEQAQEYLDSFFKLYPKLKTAITNCHSKLRTYRQVRTEIGRYRRITKLEFTNDAGETVTNWKAYRQAFNHLIQGLFADVLRIAAARIRQESLLHSEWGLKLVLTVHDELVYEVNKEYTEQAIRLVRECAENAYKLSVALPVEIQVGKIYGDMK